MKKLSKLDLKMETIAIFKSAARSDKHLSDPTITTLTVSRPRTCNTPPVLNGY